MLTHTENDYLCRVGQGTPMGAYLRRFWLPAMLKEELAEPDGAPVRLRLLGEDLVAFRDTSGRVGVVAQACPHRGASMFFGRNEEDGLRCVYHGWKFDTEGACVDMPNEPAESNFKHKIRATAYPAVERANLIWVYMGPRGLEPPLPHFEFMDVQDDWLFTAKIMYECNYVQAIEGEIDTTHAAFLHSTLDSAEKAKTSSTLGGKYQYGNRWARFFVTPSDFGINIGAQRPVGDDMAYWRISHWLQPVFTLIPREPNSDVRWGAWVPRDDESTWVILLKWNPHHKPVDMGADFELKACRNLIPGTWRAFYNKDNDYLIDRELQRTVRFSGIRQDSGRAEDAAMMETMGPIVNRSREHLGTTDAAVIAMRRGLIRGARALEQGVEPFAAAHPDVYLVRSSSCLIPFKDFYLDVPEVRQDVFVHPELWDGGTLKTYAP